MAQVNGLDHTDQNMADTDKTEEYTKLVEYGINARVAEELCNVYKTGLLRLVCIALLDLYAFQRIH